MVGGALGHNAGGRRIDGESANKFSGLLDGAEHGVDPVQLYVSIAGLSYFYLSNSYTLSAIFGRDLLTPKGKSERLSHMVDMVLGYLLRS